jgi:hypothetical protein
VCAVTLSCSGVLGSSGAGEPQQELTEQEVQVCTRLLFEEQCTGGFSQDQFDLSVECGNENRNLRGDCVANAMGDVCFTGLRDAIVEDPEITSVCGDSPTACTPDCRDLLTTTRDRLGCCVNSYNDTELSSRAGSLQFSYSLWSLCGVELVAEQCESTIVLNRTQFDHICTREEYYHRLRFNVFL